MVRAMSRHVKRSLNPRVIAASVLAAVEARPEAFAGDLLADAFSRAPGLDARDRALATELVQGVLRWQGLLDGSVGRFVTPPGKHLEHVATLWLRLGAYQAAFLRMPREIAVSATIDAAREAGLARLGGLLNAVLRRFVAAHGEALDRAQAEADPDRELAARAAALAAPLLPGDAGPVETVEARAGLPRWIAEALVEAFGEDAAAEATALRRRGAVTLRPTLHRGGAGALVEALRAEGLAAEATPEGLVALPEGGDPFRTEAWKQGLLVAQDVSSHAVAVETMRAFARAHPGRTPRVLDLCAGRGIKTTALADLGAEVVAVDVSARKLDSLRRLAERLGVEGRLVATLATDATGDDPRVSALGPFDVVLVDAPCSGLGTLRRHPEVAWRREAADVMALRAIQQGLFARARALVKPGGLVSYAVCTFVRAEGELPVDSMLRPLACVDDRPSRGGDAFMWRLYQDLRDDPSQAPAPPPPPVHRDGGDGDPDRVPVEPDPAPGR